MRCRIVDLRCKEVINICNGRRLGFPYDVELDAFSGHLIAIIVKGPPRFWGIFGRCDEYVVPWCDIRRIGEDLIIVDHEHGGHGRRDIKREIIKEIIG
jgi:YlmC/YmxH family sporulation protein